MKHLGDLNQIDVLTKKTEEKLAYLKQLKVVDKERKQFENEA